MATAEQRARRRAQARLARERRRGIPHKPALAPHVGRRVKQVHNDYLDFLIDNPDAITEADKPILASRASYALHGKGDPRWAVWAEFFYKDKKAAVA